MVSTNSSEIRLDSFQWDLLKCLSWTSTNSSDSNLVFSPLSIHLALSLVANGAVGQTQNEILSMMGFKSIDSLNDMNKKIMSSSTFKCSSSNTMSLANAIFTKVSQKEEFNKIAQSIYMTSSEQLSSADQINKWCSEKTQGKIPEIISSMSSSWQMIILNAVYYKGQWKSKFQSSSTMKRSFFSRNSGEMSVDFMNQMISTRFLENESFSMIELPYSDSQISAIIMLPSKSSSIDKIINSIKSSEIESCLRSMKESSVSLSLPRFCVQSSNSIKSVLIEMGMEKAFSSADFSNLCSEQLCCDDVIHKAYLKVDEQGTEAAAVSGAAMNKMSIMKSTQDSIQMVVDRPFMFMIFERSISQMLFVSKIESISDIL